MYSSVFSLSLYVVYHSAGTLYLLLFWLKTPVVLDKEHLKNLTELISAIQVLDPALSCMPIYLKSHVLPYVHSRMMHTNT